MTSVKLAPAYVLHARPFRETSLLLDVFTCDHGRISLIAKGAKRAKSTKSALLQPFSAITISWCGRSDLQTLTHVEARQVSKRLMGKALLCGLYINELLIKLLHRHDPYTRLFHAYEQLIKQLIETNDLEISLRVFELQLLKQIGYELSGNHLDPDAYYMFDVEGGFVKVFNSPAHFEVFKGSDLFKVLSTDNLNSSCLPIAKRLMRVVIHSLLHGKPLNARMLFIEGVE